MTAFWLVVLSNALFVHSITLTRKNRDDIIAKSRIELDPIRIVCVRYDVIKVSAPIVNANTLYQLTRPNGEVTDLDLKAPDILKPLIVHSSLTMRATGKLNPVVTMETNYEVFSVRQADDIVDRKEDELNGNDFLLGPVGDEDHGNWVLSAFTEDLEGQVVEMFQVISVKIIEYIEIVPSNAILSPNSTYRLRTAYPIKNLVSCELLAPKGAYDRIFERSDLEVDRCGFVLRNVTRADAGTWRVFAVGKIVYEGVSVLYVNESKSD